MTQKKSYQKLPIWLKMLSTIRKECLFYKGQCDVLIPDCDENRTTLLHCRLRAEKVVESLDDQEIQATEGVSYEEGVDLLKAFIFVVLDFTFFVESDLAEKNFSTPDAEKTVIGVLNDLNKPKSIFSQFMQHQHFDDAIGDDLAECLHWRKGALIYMYHSARESQLPRLAKESLKKLLTNGIDDLRKMLSVRQEFKVIDNDAFVHDDGNTLQLIQRGLFSDTHVLALMYAGEMCYWIVKWVDDTDSASASSPFASFSFRSLGIELLTRYKEAVTGPLKSAGWSHEKAQHILTYFQSE